MIEIFVFFFLSSIISILSGRFFLRHILLNKKFNEISMSEQGVFGLIFLSFLSLFLNFGFKIDKNISTIVLLIPIFQLFIDKNFLKSLFKNKNLAYLFFIAIISTFFIAYDNVYRPDAGIYHLPYSKIINDFKIIFGVVSLNPLFGATSIFQYTGSIFNNYIFGDIGVTIPLALLTIFFIDYFLREFFAKKNNSIYKLFLFLVLTYIFLEMNRYSEYGNDNPGHLTLLYLISLIFKKDFNLKSSDNFKLFSLVTVFVFLNKVFLFLILLLPLAIWIKNKYYLSFKYYPVFAIFFLSIWLIKNIFISGCLLYPISFTCNSKLSWYSHNQNFIIAAKNLSQFAELHSKGWKSIVDARGWNEKINDESFKNYSINKNEKEKYLKNFNWILSENNSENTQYGFYKLFNAYIFLIIILFIIFLKCKHKKKINLKLIFEEKVLVLISIISLFLLFYKAPVGRYGTSFFLILIFYAILFIFKNKIENISLSKKLGIFPSIIIIVAIFFSFKNVYRVIDNFDTKYYQAPWPRIYENREDLKYLNKGSNQPINFNKVLKNNLLNLYYINSFNYWVSDRSVICMYNNSPCAQTSNNFKEFNILKSSWGYYKIQLIKD